MTNHGVKLGASLDVRRLSYIEKIRLSVRARNTRKQLRRIFLHGAGRHVPPNVNLRNFVAKWHAHQQAINAGDSPSSFWLQAVGLANQ